MDGRIEVESEIGVGTVFNFELDFPIDTSYDLTPMVNDFCDVSVLIVDDNESSLKSLSTLTRSWQIKTQICDNAQSAIEVLLEQAGREDSIQLVLVDSKMPCGSGIDLAIRVRQEDQLEGVGIVLMSSGERTGQVVTSLDVDRIMKPVKHSDLRMAFANALQFEAVTEVPSSVSKGSDQLALKILVAEDNPVNQRLTIRLLEKHGHDVKLVQNGVEAVEYFRSEEFDLILMDVQMPEMDGLEATREIRNMSNPNARIPIIAMTAHATDADKQNCLASGIDEYLAKPFRSSELYELIGELTGRPTTKMGTSPQPRRRESLVDWEQAFETVGGDRDLLNDLFRVFLKERESMIFQIESALSKQDYKEIRRTAHSLKGALHHLGAKKAAEVAREIETMGQSESIQNAAERMSILKHMISELTRELTEFVKN